MEYVKKYWWLGFVAYAVIGVIIGILVGFNSEAGRPILHAVGAGVLWPVPLIRMLFGGGPLS